MLQRILARFHHKPYTAAWNAGGNLAETAVLVHVFDGWENRGNSWSAKGDISCSLLYGDLRPRKGRFSVPVYSAWASGVQGIIFRPGPTTRILCGNAGDSGNGRCKTQWCPSISLAEDTYDPSASGGKGGAAGCYGSWLPQDFGVFLRRTTKFNQQVQAVFRHSLDYNEIIVDGSRWTENLPQSIEAFFTSDDLGHKDMDVARGEHRKFLDRFSLDAAQVPLLHLYQSNWDAHPFEQS